MSSIIVPERDNNGREFKRNVVAQSGWTYESMPIEVETSVLNSAYCKDIESNDRPYSFKLYDNADAEITVQATADTDCVKTVFTFEPGYDYEIISGDIYQNNIPSSDIRIWVHGGAIDGGFAYTKEMIGGLNLYHCGNHIVSDGRATKMMKFSTAGVPWATNKLQFIVRHDAGVKHKFMAIVEYYRA